MAMTVNKWSVIFLIDKNPPDKIILLKRSAKKKFAPNFYTGIGGKIGDLPGLENETPLEGAYRELSEETRGELSKENIKLVEFARCVYESGLKLYYFRGEYEKKTLPFFSSKDGTLEWVGTEKLLDREFIPTTKAVCEQWQKRCFNLDVPFTVFVKETGVDKSVRLVRIIRVEDGLS